MKMEIHLLDDAVQTLISLRYVGCEKVIDSANIIKQMLKHGATNHHRNEMCFQDEEGVCCMLIEDYVNFVLEDFKK